MQKIACPHCGEQNYATSPLCWACGKALSAPAAPAAAPAAAAPPAAPEPPPVAPEPPIEPAAPQAIGPAARAETALPQKEPLPEAPLGAAAAEGLLPPGGGPKPAELEAMRLREKEYVTPPVDVEETPKSVAEWFDYAWAAVSSSRHVFDAALADYNRRRGRPSGPVSSFGCLVVGAVVLVLIVLLLLAAVAFLRP